MNKHELGSTKFTAHVQNISTPDSQRGVSPATISFDGNVFHIDFDNNQPTIDIPRSDIGAFTNSALFQEFPEFVLYLKRRGKVVINFGGEGKSGELLSSEVSLLSNLLVQNGVRVRTAFRPALYVIFIFLAILIKVSPVIGILGLAGLLYLLVTRFIMRR